VKHHTFFSSPENRHLLFAGLSEFLIPDLVFLPSWPRSIVIDMHRVSKKVIVEATQRRALPPLYSESGRICVVTSLAFSRIGMT